MYKPFNEHGTKNIDAMTVGQYALHGDVIIQRVEAVPENFSAMEVEPNSCLAYGELTGHAHKLFGTPGVDFDVRVNPTTKERHLRVVNPVALRHQEHSPIVLPPGDYKIDIQREYDPFEKLVRQVAD
jgi:hypothetical protein